ncbi:MAG TPA: hypothetical protein ENJ22_04740 [Gammaproteobacteria bacterium]|nr:hypothetical protein [Gammaproteobacteria bacterium]
MDEVHREMAARLAEGERGAVLLGSQAFMHPAFSTLCVLADVVARAARVRLGFLTDGANAAGAWLAGAVPHREPGGQRAKGGLPALDQLTQGRRAYLLLGVEPEYDSAAPAAASAALAAAEFVVAITPFRSEVMEGYAHVMLPVGPWTETGGTFVSGEGRWQSFQGVVPPRGEARPAWKVLRVLGNLCDVAGFDYLTVEEVRDELRARLGEVRPDNDTDWPCPSGLSPEEEGLVRIADVPCHAVDGVVRRATALQQTPDAGRAAAAVHPDLADRLGLQEGMPVLVRQGDWQATLPLTLDARVPQNCVLVPQGLRATRSLGLPGAGVELARIQ